MKTRRGIIVPINGTERTLRELRKANLIDDSLELLRTKDELTVPLIRSLSGEELQRLRVQSDVRETENSFPERPRKIRDFRELLTNIPHTHTSGLPRSFDVIGDIAILEVPEPLTPWGQKIGEALLQTLPSLRLVLRKTSKVSGVHRTTEFQRLAGEGSSVTVHREFSCTYELDVTQVYFNPRLSGERMRVASEVKAGECIVDMFAGVGPYSILAAKKQPDCLVYSIDINPAAVKYLRENTLSNKVADRVNPILGDAKQLATGQLKNVADRVIMNLPSDSRNLVASALEILKSKGGIIHYYTFAEREERLEAIKETIRRVVEAGGRTLRYPHAEEVKEVSPAKVQIALDLEVT